jgi:hypothetical protein
MDQAVGRALSLFDKVIAPLRADGVTAIAESPIAAIES